VRRHGVLRKRLRSRGWLEGQDKTAKLTARGDAARGA